MFRNFNWIAFALGAVAAYIVCNFDTIKEKVINMIPKKKEE